MGTSKGVKATDTWAGTFKAIGIRSLSTGRFWQFCFLCVLIWLIAQIDSPDWVKIAELFLSSYVYSGLGWVLFATTVIVAVLLHRAQRARYLSEIERVVKERDELQKLHLPQTRSSKLRNKK